MVHTVDDSKPESMNTGSQDQAISQTLHELFQPLTAINNYAQAGLRISSANSNEGPEIKQLFEQICEEVQRAGEICRKIPR